MNGIFTQTPACDCQHAPLEACRVLTVIWRDKVRGNIQSRRVTHRLVVDVVHPTVEDGGAVSEGRDISRVGRVQLRRGRRRQGGIRYAQQ
ncbi:hypothetical protein E2C01_075816 [Portunus trituberculatus]|uniref:Uncharacterized protein n=1 Tax=Portunus trituberculatus TaxID=210409 RepID=A0A5B7IHA7_PORTR|nr:hypothetical protein [Portunus trituberculatus]